MDDGLDLDELDRLHAALKSGQIEAVIVGQAREVVTLLNAYPALAAEARALREETGRLEAERFSCEQRAIEAEALYQPQQESENLLRRQLETVERQRDELARAARPVVEASWNMSGLEVDGDTVDRLAAALAKVPR